MKTLRKRYAEWRENARRGNELVETSIRALRFEAKKLEYWSGHFPKCGVSSFLGILALEWLFMGMVVGYCFAKMSFGGYLFISSLAILIAITIYEEFYSGKARKLDENTAEKAT